MSSSPAGAGGQWLPGGLRALFLLPADGPRSWAGATLSLRRSQGLPVTFLGSLLVTRPILSCL